MPKPRHFPGWNTKEHKLLLNLPCEACYWFLYLKEEMQTVNSFLLSTFCKREEKETKKDYEDCMYWPKSEVLSTGDRQAQAQLACAAATHFVEQWYSINMVCQPGFSKSGYVLKKQRH